MTYELIPPKEIGDENWTCKAEIKCFHCGATTKTDIICSPAQTTISYEGRCKLCHHKFIVLIEIDLSIKVSNIKIVFEDSIHTKKPQTTKELIKAYQALSKNNNIPLDKAERTKIIWELKERSYSKEAVAFLKEIEQHEN